MATPSLHRSFDVSLVDVQRSFSSTETNTSGGSSEKENVKPQNPADATVEDLQSVDDNPHDNSIQNLDDAQSSAMVSKVKQDLQAVPSPSLTILDLGCGTGRTTTNLVRYNWHTNTIIEAWDADAATLNLARATCMAARVSERTMQLDFREMKVSDLEDPPREFVGYFDCIVSRLALQGAQPLAFWRCIQKLLKPGGRGFVSGVYAARIEPDGEAVNVRTHREAAGQNPDDAIGVTIAALAKAGLRTVGEVKRVALPERRLLDNARGLASQGQIGRGIYFGLSFQKD